MKKEKETRSPGEKGAASLAKRGGLMRPSGVMPMWGFEPMHDVFRDFFRQMRPFEFPPPMSMSPAMESFGWPRMDMYEKDGDLVLEAALPGIDKDDISVHLSEESLTIKGSARSEEEKEEEETYLRESFQGTFSRTITLPCEVISDAIKASFKEGILKIILPMREPQGRKKIQIEID